MSDNQIHDDFEQHVSELYDFIYQGCLPMHALNAANVDIKYTKHGSGYVEHDKKLKIVFKQAGVFELGFDKDKQLVSMTNPTNHTDYYKFDKNKNDWVNAHSNKRDPLLFKLYTDLDARGEGWPHFGFENQFHRPGYAPHN